MRNNDIPASLPTAGFVRLPVILKVLSIGKTSWWNGIREGKYPRPTKFGSRTARWHVEEIRALIAKYREAAGNNGGSMGTKKEENPDG